METVDLIFNEKEGIDFEALQLSLEKLRVETEGVDIAITVLALEKKPDGSFLVRVSVPLEANKSEVEKFLKHEYDSGLRVIEARYKTQLQLQDEQLIFYREEMIAKRQHNTELVGAIKTMAEQPKYDQRGSINNFVDTAQSGSQQLNIQYINMSQDLGEAAAQIQALLEQLQKGDVTVGNAQKQVARDLATQAQGNPTMKDKLWKWGQSLGDATVSDVVKETVKLAIRSAGLPLP